MLSLLDSGSLFPPLDSEYSQYNKILKGIESLDASCFYGRLFGSQVFLSEELISYAGIKHLAL